MTPFTILSILLTLAALAAYVNDRWIGLPPTAALMLLSLLLSLALVAGDRLGLPLEATLQTLLRKVDFSETLLGGMLSFLLFAGALNIDLKALHRQRWRIFSLAFVSTLLSAVVVAGLSWLVLRALGFPTPLLYCLLFGALISPTDPVAVLSSLGRSSASEELKIKFAGESLLNDGAGLVAFLFFLESLVATGPQMDLEWQRGLQLLVQEAGGGVVLGLALGWAAFYLIKTTDDTHIEIMLTLALVTGGYSLALLLHTSGPLAIATAGLVIGNPARQRAMSERTRRELDTFWKLIDEILNALLFVLVGLQIVAVKDQLQFGWAALAMIPVVLLARFVSLALPRLGIHAFRGDAGAGSLLLLTWGGLRGAVSVALALSLPGGRERDLLLTATYAVVAFSILVQGSTMPMLLRSPAPRA